MRPSDKFNALNGQIKRISHKIAVNHMNEAPLIRRAAVETLSASVVLCFFARLAQTNTVVDPLFFLIPAAIVMAPIVDKGVETYIKRIPYQKRGIGLSKTLNRHCKRLREEFPRAKWSSKDRAYRIAPKDLAEMDKVYDDMCAFKARFFLGGLAL